MPKPIRATFGSPNNGPTIPAPIAYLASPRISASSALVVGNLLFTGAHQYDIFKSAMTKVLEEESA